MSLFAKYLGKLSVEVDGEKLELDVRLKDKQKIMALMTEFGEKLTEEVLSKLSNVFLEILKRSYPNTSEEELEAFLTKKFEDFMIGLSIAFGWTTKKEIEKSLKENVKKGILRSKGEQD